MFRGILCAAFVLGLVGSSLAREVPVTSIAAPKSQEAEVVKVDEKGSKITLKVNGKEQEFSVSDKATLVDAKGEKLKSLADVKGKVTFQLGKGNTISRLQLSK